ncbi:uncharacterized protein LOC108047171 [Drosophila rhopaloa]|uniref:Uncharacterized protein LOC108047171 n=1 Tax=Drosophila rhopaloa TaxID=1041015 RepID=A0A6P4F5Y2_DRORH|nr:uncharacterized protein LOC108047171 [Drosophila rhopaloa]
MKAKANGPQNDRNDRHLQVGQLCATSAEKWQYTHPDEEHPVNLTNHISELPLCHKPGDDRDHSNIGKRKSNIKATAATTTATGARQSAKLSDIVRCVPKEQPQEQQQQQMQHQQQQQLQHNSNRQPRDNGQATGASQVNGQ